MSDSEDFDGEFQGLKLRQSANFTDDVFHKPLQPSKLQRINENEVDDWFGNSKSSKSPEKSEKSPNFSYEASFSGSFLEEGLFGKGRGFGESEDEDDDDDVANSGDVRKSEKEEFVGIDWDASTIFKNLSCPETNSEKSVCVLRLHDVLTKSEQGVQKITRQMINCGRQITTYNPQKRRDFGFSNAGNLKDLNQLLISLRASINLMLLETEDLQRSLNPPVSIENSRKIPKKYWFLAGILSAGLVFKVVA